MRSHLIYPSCTGRQGTVLVLCTCHVVAIISYDRVGPRRRKVALIRVFFSTIGEKTHTHGRIISWGSSKQEEGRSTQFVFFKLLDESTHTSFHFTHCAHGRRKGGRHRMSFSCIVLDSGLLQQQYCCASVEPGLLMPDVTRPRFHRL